MTFASDIKAWEQKALLAANNSVSKAFESLTREVVMRSPTPPGMAGWSVGHLKDNWHASIGSMSTENTDSRNSSGAASIASIRAIVAQRPFLGKDNVLFFTNNTRYAYRVEFLGWPKGKGGGQLSFGKWQGAQPYHMVSLSVANFKGLRP